MQTRGGIKLLTPGMRIILYIAALLVLIAGVQLFILGEQTDRFFAWTIKSPITAAFMGAGYWSSFALVLGGAMQRYWAQARVSVPSPTVFSVLILIATLLHLDQMHLAAGLDFFPTFAAWAWIIVYVAVPIMLIILLLVQSRTPGIDPPRLLPLSKWMRLALLAQGAIMLLLGFALFIAPLQVATIWPWKLTPFTAQVVGCWLVGLGIAATQAAWENELTRLPAAAASYAVFSIFQLIVLLRYPALIDWASPSAWLYLGFLLTMLVVAITFLATLLRTRQTQTEPAITPLP